MNASEMRLSRIREALPAAAPQAEAFAIRDTSNIAWACGWQGVFDEERAHVLLVTSDAATLHTDSRYAGACRAAAGAGPVVVDDDRTTHAKWLAAHAPAGPVAVEDTYTLRELHDFKAALPMGTFLETRDVVLTLRQVKDAAEVACLRAAQAITDAAFTHMTHWMHPGMTEAEVAVELESFMRAHGAAGLAFPSIVACGASGANPHAQPSDARLEAGQCVVMDFGARAAGYCSDMTRMVFVGEPPQRIRQAYAALREANEAVEAALRPGVTGAQMHNLALDVLDQAGWPDAFAHGLGHGVGIDIHEEPVLAPRNTMPLVAGNVVTVEPGIYIEGEFGMRLEDFGIITDGGFDVFTQSTHEMVII